MFIGLPPTYPSVMVDVDTRLKKIRFGQTIGIVSVTVSTAN